MTFYALLPIYALLVARLSPKKVAVWADAVPLVVLASASLAFHAVYLDKSNHKIASTLPGTFYWFALGMGLAVASVWAHGGDRAPFRVVVRQGTLCWVAALAAFLVLCAVVTPTGFHSGNLAEHVALGTDCPPDTAARGIRGEVAGPVPAVLSLRSLAWIGLVSYAFYLWHYYVMIALRSHHLHGLTQHYSAFFVLSFVGAITLAAGSYYLIERPALRFKQGRRFNRLAIGGSGRRGLRAPVHCGHRGARLPRSLRVRSRDLRLASRLQRPSPPRRAREVRRRIVHACEGRDPLLRRRAAYKLSPGSVRGNVDVSQVLGE